MMQKQNRQEEVERALARIRRMETFFGRVTHARLHEAEKLHSPELQAEIRALSAYLSDGDWLHDYELDEQGMLPSDLKRGVLSQDGLYELLSACREAEHKSRSSQVGQTEA